MALTAPTASSWAQKRVVVLDVEGARNNTLRDSLAEVVGEENRVISAGKYKRAARKLKTKRKGTAHFKKVAAKLEADGFIQGLVIDEGSRYALKLRLRDGASGRTVKRVTLKLKRPVLDSPMRRKLAKKLLPAIDKLQFNEGEASEPDDAEMRDEAEDDAAEVVDTDDERLSARERRAERKRAKRERAAERKRAKRERAAERKRAKREKAERKRRAERERRVAAREAKEARRNKKRKLRERRVDDEDEDFDDEELDDEDLDEEPIDDAEDEDADDVAMADDDVEDDDGDFDGGARKRVSFEDDEERSAAQRRRDGAMLISAGASVLNRRLAFTVRPELENGPQGYTGPPVPAGHVSGELYPLALDRKRSGLAANIGIGFHADRVFGLKTGVTSNGMTVNLATEETHYSAGLIVRHNFGSSATSPSVKLTAGYSRLSFVVEQQEGVLVDLPNTSYTYVDPGLELRVPLGSKVALAAGGKAMLITASGEMQRRDQYGSAKLTGFEAGGGLEFMVGSNFLIQAKAKYLAIGFEFTGDGDMIVMRDGDPNTVDIGGALDTYMVGTISAGYLY